MTVNWIDYNRDNILEVYADYIKEIELNPNKKIVTKALCLVKYKKPKHVYGISGSSQVKYIDTNESIVTTDVLITFISYITINGEVSRPQPIFKTTEPIIKFCPIEHLKFD